jgi:hypothetical protein
VYQVHREAPAFIIRNAATTDEQTLLPMTGSVFCGYNLLSWCTKMSDYSCHFSGDRTFKCGVQFNVSETVCISFFRAYDVDDD